MDDETSSGGDATPDPDDVDGVEDEVRRANRAFYEAFESADMDAMSDLWAHDDDVVCTHPGWGALHGWGAVVGSWAALFAADQRLQFILTNERVRVEGDLAWVTVDENLIDQTGREMSGDTVAAVNLFRRRAGRWRMVLHHGSPVVSATPTDWADL